MSNANRSTSPIDSDSSGAKIIDFSSRQTGELDHTYTNFDYDSTVPIGAERNLGSSIDVNDLSLVQANPSVGKSMQAIKVLRTHYSKELITLFSWLVDHHEPGTPNSIAHLNEVFRLLDQYSEEVFEDPFSGFLLAIYDAIADKNYGIELEPEVFGRIGKIITDLNNQEIDYKKVDHYINKLTEMGLNVLPYS